MCDVCVCGTVIMAPGLEANFGGLIGLAQASVVALAIAAVMWKARLPAQMVAALNLVILAPLMIWTSIIASTKQTMMATVKLV